MKKATLVLLTLVALMAVAFVYADPSKGPDGGSDPVFEPTEREVVLSRWDGTPMVGVLVNGKGVLEPRVILHPSQPWGVCTDAECKTECEQTCKKAGHGSKVIDVETTTEGCFATCGDSSGAKCYSLSPCPENAKPDLKRQ